MKVPQQKMLIQLEGLAGAVTGGFAGVTGVPGGLPGGEVGGF